MSEVTRSGDGGSTFNQALSSISFSELGAWAFNVVAWIVLVAQVREPLSIAFAVGTGWCALEGIRLRSFPLVITALVNTWWLLA